MNTINQILTELAPLRRRFRAAGRAVIATAILTLALSSPAQSPIVWNELAPIPDDHGFAGPYAGMIDGHLIVAGGANFPNSPPWEGGTKAWHDRVFVLPKESSAWKLAEFRLPNALAYGVSINLPERGSIAMLGGSDGDNNPTTSAMELFYDGEAFRTEPLPALPIPLTESSGVALGNVLYLFSGRTTEGTAQKAYRLDLDASSPAWEELPWPAGARGRMYSVAGVRDGKLYLFAGRDHSSDATIDHPEDRMEPYSLDFLRDAYRLDPNGLQWTRLADLPHGLSAAPASAVASGSSHLLVLGGVGVDFLKQQIADRPELNGQGNDHPGFPRTIWAYHTITDTWIASGELPDGVAAPVTVPVVPALENSFIEPPPTRGDAR